MFTFQVKGARGDLASVSSLLNCNLQQLQTLLVFLYRGFSSYHLQWQDDDTTFVYRDGNNIEKKNKFSNRLA
jgi:hypothetical protein